jgi:hypothetical protein
MKESEYLIGEFLNLWISIHLNIGFKSAYKKSKIQNLKSKTDCRATNF